MNLYLRELKAHRKSIFIWCVAMIFLIFAGISKYSAGLATGDNFNDMMKQMPQSLQNLFGVGLFDLSKMVDYFGVFYLYLALMATVHAVMLGNGIIAKEERDKTAEFLLVKPITRYHIITAKLSAAFTLVVVFNLVTWGSSLLAFAQFSEGEDYFMPLLRLMAGLLALQIIFMLMGTVLAAFSNRYKISSAIATGSLMIMFLMSVIIDISGKIDFLRGLTLFKYFDAKDILKSGYNFIYLFIGILLSALFTYGTYFFYKKRDMKI